MTKFTEQTLINDAAIPIYEQTLKKDSRFFTRTAVA